MHRHRPAALNRPVDRSTPRLPPRYRECHSVKMFWSKAVTWVESLATAVVPSPHSHIWRAAKVALAIARAASRQAGTVKYRRRA